MGTAPSLTGEVLRFTLEAVKGPHVGQKFEFNRSSITIGRGPENDIVLAEDPRVSRQHVEIKQSLGQFYVINLSQKNFVLVNGTNVTSEKIESRSTVQVGETELMFSVQGSTSLLEPLSPGSVSIPLNRVGVGVQAPPRPQGIPGPPPMPGVPPAVMNNPYGANAPQAWNQMPPPAMPNANPYQYTPPPPRAEAPPSPVGNILKNGRVRLYGVIGIVLVVGYFAVNGSNRKPHNENRAFRTVEEIDVARQETENDMKLFRERKDKMNAMIYQKAYENFLRGYRDYRQGQFARARDAFQVVLNLDPENELGKRYFNLAKIRFDEIVKFHMLQGRRYLEKQNYRMCRSNLQTVMTMLGNDQTNAEYKEAKILHERCTAAFDGRY